MSAPTTPPSELRDLPTAWVQLDIDPEECFLPKLKRRQDYAKGLAELLASLAEGFYETRLDETGMIGAARELAGLDVGRLILGRPECFTPAQVAKVRQNNGVGLSPGRIKKRVSECTLKEASIHKNNYDLRAGLDVGYWLEYLQEAES